MGLGVDTARNTVTTPISRVQYSTTTIRIQHPIVASLMQNDCIGHSFFIRDVLVKGSFKIQPFRVYGTNWYTYTRTRTALLIASVNMSVRIACAAMEPSVAASRSRFESNRSNAMTLLKWALIFFLVSIVAGVFGFTGISAATADVAKILFYIFLVICILLLVLGITIFRA